MLGHQAAQRRQHHRRGGAQRVLKQKHVEDSRSISATPPFAAASAPGLPNARARSCSAVRMPPSAAMKKMMMDCTIRITSLEIPADSSMERLPIFSTAKNRLIRITPNGLIAHDHGHQHSVKVELVGNGGHKPFVQAEYLQHTRQAADRAGQHHGPEHQLFGGNAAVGAQSGRCRRSASFQNPRKSGSSDTT